MSSILKLFPTAGQWIDVAKTTAVAVFTMPERGLELLHVWERRLKQRQALGRMDMRLLDDMGIRPEDAARESAKPFWRA